MQKIKEKFFDKWYLFVKFLYQPIFSKKETNDLGKLPEGEKDIEVNKDFLDDFLKDTNDGRRWCEEGAMHWAEILTFSFSKMIITFDLGVLAFIGAIRESFFNSNILIFSIASAFISLLILTVFIRSVIVKNINSLAERVRILNYTTVLLPQKVKNRNDAECVMDLMKKQGKSLQENLCTLDDHTKKWVPWQRIGLYLFYFSVLATFIGIVL